MSILAASTRPAAPELQGPGVAGWAIVAAVVLGLAYATRLLRPGSLRRPDRLPLEQSGGVFFLVMIVGMAIWFGLQVVYSAVRISTVAAAARGGAGPEGGFDESMLSPADYAFLSTVPPLLGFVALVVGDHLMGRPRLAAGLGYTGGRAGRGVLLGALAMAFTFPLVFATSFMTEYVYQRIDFEHPQEHGLLRVMAEARSPALRWLIIAGAAVGAPLFEEMFFRAHLQTLIRSGGLWLAGARRAPRRPAPAGGFEIIPPPSLPPLPPVTASAEPPPPPPEAHDTSPRPALPAESPPMPPPAPDAPLKAVPAWPSWVAIGLTSVVFASVHPLWTAPIIFVLSLCLGYTYERTGNLWATITMHALFNGVSTAVFLGTRQ